MAIRMPRIISAKKFLRQHSLTRNQETLVASDVPKGYLAVYVGEQEWRRFVVPVSILNKRSFQDLLGEAEEEFGFYHHMGGLTIPCRLDTFLDLISQLN